MTWQYDQATGCLSHDGRPVGTGYSGHGEGVNNPAMQDVRSVGPIPRGQWSIGPARLQPILGPVAMPLAPEEGTETFGRTGFWAHGTTKPWITPHRTAASFCRERCAKPSRKAMIAACW
jgi:hypothetical protein